MFLTTCPCNIIEAALTCNHTQNSEQKYYKYKFSIFFFYFIFYFLFFFSNFRGESKSLYIAWVFLRNGIALIGRYLTEIDVFHHVALPLKLICICLIRTCMLSMMRLHYVKQKTHKRTSPGTGKCIKKEGTPLLVFMKRYK